MLDPEDVGGDMAKDGSETFRLDSDLKERLRKAAFSCDKTKSEFICRCIQFALPFFEADPSSVETIETIYKLRSKKEAQ